MNAQKWSRPTSSAPTGPPAVHAEDTDAVVRHPTGMTARISVHRLTPWHWLCLDGQTQLGLQRFRVLSVTRKAQPVPSGAVNSAFGR